MPDLEIIAGIPLYNPVGETRIAPKRLHPLPGDWRGKTVGFLDNTKPNFDLLLQKLGRLLRQQYQVAEIVYRRKPNSASAASPETLAELARRCDVAITGSGD